jgi:hypothetical protein
VARAVHEEEIRTDRLRERTRDAERRAAEAEAREAAADARAATSDQALRELEQTKTFRMLAPVRRAYGRLRRRGGHTA